MKPTRLADSPANPQQSTVIVRTAARRLAGRGGYRQLKQVKECVQLQFPLWHRTHQLCKLWSVIPEKISQSAGTPPFFRLLSSSNFCQTTASQVTSCHVHGVIMITLQESLTIIISTTKTSAHNRRSWDINNMK
jgi:hypothetical protein